MVFCRKWNHTVGSLLNLASFSQYEFLKSIHIAACDSDSAFMLLSSILLYGHTTTCLLTNTLMHIWLVSSLEPLWIKLLQTFLYKSLCTHMFSFLLGTYWECTGWVTWKRCGQLYKKVASCFMPFANNGEILKFVFFRDFYTKT